MVFYKRFSFSLKKVLEESGKEDVASERSTVLTRCIKVYYIEEVQ